MEIRLKTWIRMFNCVEESFFQMVVNAIARRGRLDMIINDALRFVSCDKSSTETTRTEIQKKFQRTSEGEMMGMRSKVIPEGCCAGDAMI